MTIRKILMIAFLLASLVPSALLAMLAFESASAAMHAQIEQSLQVEASTVSLDIDKMLFERLQNAQTWSQLDVMQDIQIRDVDKQLATFLGNVKSGYRDVYAELLCTDAQGLVVASSDARSIGARRLFESGMPFAGRGYGAIRMQPLQWTNARTGPLLPISVDIPSKFGGAGLGKLVLLLRWQQMYRILDQASQGGRMLVVVDRNGRVIAASASLRARGVLNRQLPAEWISGRSSGTATRDGSALKLDTLSIGYDRSRGYQYFPGFGWTTLVLQPSRDAFAPVRNMALAFVVLLALTSTLAVAFSIGIAGRIARPITRLTQFTRNLRRNPQAAAPPPATGGREVTELTEAFVTTFADLEQSRADLVRAATLAALGELSAVVAHEIRTPIGILRSSAQMLAREPRLSIEGQELVGFIQSESERLNGLVSTLLESTRTRVPVPRATQLADLVRANLALLAARANERGVALVEQLPASLPMVDCDPEQMTQVFLNIVQNAIQILPRGGRVEVSASAAHGRVQVTIADDGPGIAPADLPRIFEPFFSQREGGFGLGLAAVRQIVLAHGGDVSAGTSPLGGALFTVTLPELVDGP